MTHVNTHTVLSSLIHVSSTVTLTYSKSVNTWTVSAFDSEVQLQLGCCRTQGGRPGLAVAPVALLRCFRLHYWQGQHAPSSCSCLLHCPYSGSSVIMTASVALGTDSSEQSASPGKCILAVHFDISVAAQTWGQHGHS